MHLVYLLQILLTQHTSETLMLYSSMVAEIHLYILATHCYKYTFVLSHVMFSFNFIYVGMYRNNKNQQNLFRWYKHINSAFPAKLEILIYHIFILPKGPSFLKMASMLIAIPMVWSYFCLSNVSRVMQNPNITNHYTNQSAQPSDQSITTIMYWFPNHHWWRMCTDVFKQCKQVAIKKYNDPKYQLTESTCLISSLLKNNQSLEYT